MKQIQMKSIYGILAAGLLIGCGGAASLVPISEENIGRPTKPEYSDAELKTWSHADLVNDTIPGMSVDRAYTEILSKRGKGQTTLVAVIDSGIDIEHEDLDGVIWTNPGEIAGNGKDDDNNGYIDDIHGWNFLGDTVDEQLEKARIVYRYEKEGKGSKAVYEAAKAELASDIKEAEGNVSRYSQILEQVVAADAAISKKLGKSTYTKAEVLAIQDESLANEKNIVLQMLQYADSIEELKDQLSEGIEYYGNQLKYNYSVDFKGRTTGDDPYTMDGKVYGNNDVDGPDPEKKDARHGTHVAGIIAAERNNGIGLNGVANNVEIMVLRAVPDGDEYDKDIAMAIRYAVDNGARVINTSFGKYYSPNSEWVYEAIRYAAKNDVLIVNAAGNEGLNLDTKNVYPNDQVDNGNEVSDTFLTVGALNYKYGSNLVANFSNYGKVNVDVFAPGVKIWSTTPLNTYEYLQGTSMAAPNVAGVAAVIRSQFPDLTAAEVKQILMDSGLPSVNEVVLGGDNSNTGKFGDITKSGRMVNLYNALILADQRN